MTDDGSDVDAMDILTRREVLSGGSLALLSAMGLAGTASAQTGTEPRIQLGADWEIDDYDDGSGNNNLRIRHQPSGAELVYNVTANQWELSTLDASETTLTNPTGNGVSRGFIGRDEDTDGTSPLSISFSGIGSYGMVLVYLEVNGNGGGSTGQVDIQVNNDTGTNYVQDSLANGTITQSTGNTSWFYEQWNASMVKNRFGISDNDTDLFIKQHTGTHQSRAQILNGRNNSNDLSSIQISTAFDASGMATAIGVGQI